MSLVFSTKYLSSQSWQFPIRASHQLLVFFCVRAHFHKNSTLLTVDFEFGPNVEFRCECARTQTIQVAGTLSCITTMKFPTLMMSLLKNETKFIRHFSAEHKVVFLFFAHSHSMFMALQYLTKVIHNFSKFQRKNSTAFNL